MSVLFGQLGNYVLRAGKRNDQLSGGEGNDSLDGNNTLIGGSGLDRLDGGVGSDDLSPRTSSGVAENDAVTQLAEGLPITSAFMLDSEFDHLSQRLQPFAWLGAAFESLARTG